MAGSSKYFARKYRLLFDFPSDRKYIFETKPGMPAMDIKFDVTYARGQTAREGTVSVLGLGHKLINKFISLSGETRGKAMSELVRVKLEAGYFSERGMVEVFDGFAWYATVTAPPQMWLNIKVSEYNPLGGIAVALGAIEAPTLELAVESILEKFSVAEGETFELEDKTADQILHSQGFSKLEFKETVTLKDAIGQLNRSASDKIQFVLRTHRQSNGTRIVEALDKDDKKVVRENVRVDKDNGLLSVTGIDAVNGCVTTFLDGHWPDELAHLVLKSELNPQANGTYYIVKKQYVGHFMGQEWYSRYFCSSRQKDD